MAASREEVYERVKEVLTEQLGIDEADASEEEFERLARNRNVLAAVIEAALGALFLQHGFAAIEDAVVAAFSQQIEHALTSRVDHKTDLQELLARRGQQVSYAEVSVEGPPH